MPKRTYKDIPERYPVCLADDCPLAATCLHQLVLETLMQKETYLQLINPNQCSKDDTCPFYRNNQLVTYARGFTGFQKRMYPAQYHTFMNLLTSTFGRNGYFERRRGDTILSPKEQRIIREALKQAGVTEELQFDAYEELSNWYD